MGSTHMGILTKNDLKLPLKSARKVRQKLSKNFWMEGIGFFLDGARFTHKQTHLIKSELLKLWLGEDLIRD